MRRTGLLIAILVLCPAFAPAANREMIELQRDVAQLQDQVRDLQRSFDEKLAALQVLVQQTLDSANEVEHIVAGSGSRPGGNHGARCRARRGTEFQDGSVEQRRVGHARISQRRNRAHE